MGLSAVECTRTVSQHKLMTYMQVLYIPTAAEDTEFTRDKTTWYNTDIILNNADMCVYNAMTDIMSLTLLKKDTPRGSR